MTLKVISDPEKEPSLQMQVRVRVRVRFHTLTKIRAGLLSLVRYAHGELTPQGVWLMTTSWTLTRCCQPSDLPGGAGLEIRGSSVGQDLPLGFPYCLSSGHHPHLHSGSAEVYESPPPVFKWGAALHPAAVTQRSGPQLCIQKTHLTIIWYKLIHYYII